MTLQGNLSDHGIRLRHYNVGSSKILCPQCSHTRKNKTEPCLSVTVDDKGAVWKCHNCNWEGSANDRAQGVTPMRRVPVKVDHKAGSLPPAVVEWFAKRAIPLAVLERNRIGHVQTWLPGCDPGTTEGAITFPYLRGGEVVNIKYRGNGKRFKQVKDAEKIYFGLDDIAGQSTVIICEGECDKLALEVAGFLNCVSVPDGAPKLVKDQTPDPEDDTKFSYVWNCREAFEGVTKIILATDGDGPGEALAEELARRYGKVKCWKVTWAAINDVPCKDANEVLVEHGADVLREVIEHAQPFPIKSLGQASDPTAIAITEDRRLVRHLERIPLGTPYPKVIGRIRELHDALPGCRLVVDGTGVGRAVVDAMEESGLSPVVVTITSGKRIRREGKRIWMPKALLIGPLITGLEFGDVQIASSLPDAGALVRELKAFKVTRGEGGHLSYEGKGEHDDLVIAVALSLMDKVFIESLSTKD